MSKHTKNNEKRLHSSGSATKETRHPIGEAVAYEVRTALAGSCPPPIILDGGED